VLDALVIVLKIPQTFTSVSAPSPLPDIENSLPPAKDVFDPDPVKIVSVLNFTVNVLSVPKYTNPLSAILTKRE
jgi:hypothetical protein